MFISLVPQGFDFTSKIMCSHGNKSCSHVSKTCAHVNEMLEHMKKVEIMDDMEDTDDTESNSEGEIKVWIKPDGT